MIIWNAVFKVLWLEKNPVGYFFEASDNSFDIVYVGSSNVYAHFNAPLAFNKYGFTTGLLSTDTQPFALIKYLIEESEKHQNPKLYVIDIAKLIHRYDEVSEFNIRKTVDEMPFSKTRIDAINASLDYYDISKQENKSGDNRINYYLSYLTYHNNWKNISYLSFLGNKNLYKGYLFNSMTAEVVKQEKYKWPTKEKELSKLQVNILNELLNFIKKDNLDVLFIIPPRQYDDYVYYIDHIAKIITDGGFEVINFNKEKKLKIDYDTDFYNSNHINVFGATKFTLYFSKYLKNKYDLPDHRSDEEYDSWNKEYLRFKTNFKEIVGKSFDELLIENKEYL